MCCVVVFCVVCDVDLLCVFCDVDVDVCCVGGV